MVPGPARRAVARGRTRALVQRLKGRTPALCHGVVSLRTPGVSGRRGRFRAQAPQSAARRDRGARHRAQSGPPICAAGIMLQFSPHVVPCGRAVMRGLNCTNATPYVRRAVLECGVQQPSLIGKKLAARCGNVRYAGASCIGARLGLPALRMARKNALMCLGEAPPDSPDMREILNGVMYLAPSPSGVLIWI